MPDPTEANGDIVMGVAELLRREDQGVDSLPGKIKVMIDRDSWRSFRDPKGDLHAHDDFGEFVTADPFDGLGFEEERFVAFTQADPALEARVRNLLNAGRHGGDHKSKNRQIKSNNVTLDPERRGNATQYLIRRLLKDGHNDLAGRLEAGKVTAAAARREVGYRALPTTTIRTDDVGKALHTLLRFFTEDELRKALEALR